MGGWNHSKQVRVVSENNHEGRAGRVQAVYKVFATEAEGEHIDVEIRAGKSSFFARLGDVQEDSIASEPSPFKLDFRRIKAAKRVELKNTLEGKDGNLEKVEENVLLEQSTVAAILAETELRLQPKDTMILKPSVTTPWANDEVVEDLGGEVATTKVSIQTTKHVFFVLWSEPPRHYTYLYVRNILFEPRHIEFKDSCPNEAAHQAATKVLQNLGLIGAEEQAPQPSNTSRQEDGWSCGLWASRWIERQLRENKGEPRLPPTSLAEMRTRANEFIEKIKAVGKPAEPKPVPELKVSKGPRPTHEPEHPSFEAALEAGLLCTKCIPTKAGTKGCRACMGEFFEQIRQRKTRGA